MRRVGAEIATVNSCGDQRGVSELRIGTNNRRGGDCEKDHAGGVHGNRRRELRGVSELRIGTNNRREGDCEKDYAGGVHGNRRGDLRGNLRQEIGTEICREGVEPVELRGGTENRNGQEQVQKKTAKKSRSYGGVEFSGGGFGSHPYRLDKTVVVLSPMQGPEFRLSRRRVRGTVCTANSGLFFRPRVYSGLPAPAPCFGSKRLPRFRLRVPTS